MNSQNLSKEEAEKKAADYYKKPKRKQFKSLGKNKMSYDQMYMLQGYFESETTQLTRSEIWAKFREINKEREQKSLDIKLQAEHDESSFTKGRETSYGESGTKDTLLDEYGVKVKRQNGDEITNSEIDQIKVAMDDTAKVFGHNPQMNKDFGLKISHSGDVKMHASKATGVFFPYYKAIGVSNEYGGEVFNFVFGHEYAHFADYWIGKKTGNHFASDKYGSTANQIATIFRSNMNKSSDSDYINRTCECFARALEQHVAIETKGEGAKAWGKQSYLEADYYVNKNVYENQLKPLIKQFLEENKEILKSMENDFGINLFDLF
jgi:hypothetical protein